MPKKTKNAVDIWEEIKIPLDYIEIIDQLIQSGTTKYTSREDFIKNAVEVKLQELKMLKPLLGRGIFPH
jgi:Arc/MetJ-type ribon-helix-helix transcriptional regulator